MGSKAEIAGWVNALLRQRLERTLWLSIYPEIDLVTLRGRCHATFEVRKRRLTAVKIPDIIHTIMDSKIAYVGFLVRKAVTKARLSRRLT